MNRKANNYLWRNMRLILNVWLVVTFFVSVSSVFAESQVFVAERSCIIHEEANSSSADLGRIEIGQKALILQAEETSKWIKVDRDGVKGWVYKPRGKIVDQQVAESGTQEMHFWFGNIHAHTSEGSSESNVSESTHEEAFLYAMDDDKGNLDFLAVTPPQSPGRIRYLWKVVGHQQSL